MKKTISVVLALLLLASVSVMSFAEPVVKKVQTAEKSDIDKQIDMIYANLSELSQDTINGLWNYTVTDLDHNGSLELIAAICKSPDYRTYAKVYEVSEGRDAFIDCDMSVAEGEPFVDILQDSADTYYDRTTDTWHYLFSEDFTRSLSEHYSTKCSVSLKSGYVKPVAYATEHIEIENGFTVVSFQDPDGRELTPEEFNAAGDVAFQSFEKSGTNFGWFTMKDATTASVLTDSYKVFVGEKQAENTLKADQNRIYVVDGPVEDPFLRISKNPTSEYHYEGETAYFIARANNATSMTWTFVSPSGSQYSASDFEHQFIQCKVSGADSNTLTIRNVSRDMTGWGAYCTFYGGGQTSRSSTAYLTVVSKSDPKPVPTYSPVTKSIGGYVSDYLMSSVTIYLNNGTTVQVLKDICRVPRGHLDYGCSCTCYYEGNTPTSSNITSVEIIGKDDPVYNSTSGSYSVQGTDNYAVAIYVPIAGTTVYVSPSIVSYSGTPYDGCPCTVSYTGNDAPTGGSGGSIYAVSVYGSEQPITPAPNPNPYEPDGWECSQCGYQFNSGYSTHCENCGCSRYGAGTGWDCSVCGQWNDEYTYNCLNCGNPRYWTGLLTNPTEGNADWSNPTAGNADLS